MPSKSFFPSARKLIGKPNRPSLPLSSKDATPIRVRAVCYSPTAKRISMLTKALLKPFEDLKAEAKNTKSQTSAKNSGNIKSNAPPTTSALEGAVIIHPTASKACQSSLFRLETVVIIDNVTATVPSHVLRDVTVPAQSPILVTPAPVCEAALIVLARFAVGLLIVKEEKIHQLRDSSSRSNQAFKSLTLQLESATEQIEKYRVTNRKLTLENRHLKKLRSASKQVISSVKYDNFLLKDEVQKKTKMVQKAIPQYSAAQTRASQAENTAAALQKIVEFWQQSANAYQSQNAQLQATAVHWRDRSNAAEEARDNERLAHAQTQADVSELRAINDGLTFRSRELLEERAAKDSSFQMELDIKDSRIAELEAELATLRVEKSPRNKSNSSTSFATSSADGEEGSLLSSRPTSNGNARPVRSNFRDSSLPPSSTSLNEGASSGPLNEEEDEWEDEEDEPAEDTDQQAPNEAAIVNSRHPTRLRGTTTPSSSPPKMGKYTVEPPSTSLGDGPVTAPATTPLPGFSFSFGDNVRDPFSSSPPSYTPPSLPPPSSPMAQQPRPSFGESATEKEEAVGGYSTRGRDLAFNAVEFFAPVGASPPLASTSPTEGSTADVEMMDIDDIPEPATEPRVDATVPPEPSERTLGSRKIVKPSSGPSKGGKGKVLKFGKNALGNVEPYVLKEDLANEEVVGDEQEGEVMGKEDVKGGIKEDTAGTFEKSSEGSFTFNFSVAPDANPFSWN